MNFIKEVLKKLFLAAITGALAENVTIDTQSKVEEKKAKTEQTFEEYKNSLNPDRKADAFNELDEETKF